MVRVPFVIASVKLYLFSLEGFPLNERSVRNLKLLCLQGKNSPARIEYAILLCGALLCTTAVVRPPFLVPIPQQHLVCLGSGGSFRVNFERSQGCILVVTRVTVRADTVGHSQHGLFFSQPVRVSVSSQPA